MGSARATMPSSLKNWWRVFFMPCMGATGVVAVRQLAGCTFARMHITVHEKFASTI